MAIKQCRKKNGNDHNGAQKIAVVFFVGKTRRSCFFVYLSCFCLFCECTGGGSKREVEELISNSSLVRYIPLCVNNLEKSMAPYPSYGLNSTRCIWKSHFYSKNVNALSTRKRVILTIPNMLRL